MKSKLFKFFAVIMLFALITPSVFVQAQADGPNLPEVNRPELDELGSLLVPSKTGRYILIFEGNSLVEETSSARVSINAGSYLETLAAQREGILSRIETQLGRSLRVHYVYDVILNGVSVEMTAEEAAEVAALPEVTKVLPVTLEHPLTDAGPKWIGADTLWDGSAVPVEEGETKGEGVLVGIIDTGINFDHPSFSDAPSDGYTYPETTKLGVCANKAGGDYESACNNKLIGAWSFVTEDLTPEDSDGHGSHTASTVAGNTIDVDGMTISGVAPHAQIISYDACVDSCPTDALTAAVHQAVNDGVDVINYSISGGNDPFNDPVELAFLEATQAGIVVATSAGNSGPDAGTVAHRSPWVLSTAATTHNRTMTSVVNFSHEDYGDIWTLSGSIPFTEDVLFEDVVYAGEDEGNDLGCNAFPEDFFDGSIALIKRGTCPFDVKVDNAEAAGAEGVLVFTSTLAPGAMGSVTASIPNVMLNIPGTLGDEIAAWVAAETDDNVSITAEDAILEDSIADIMADFSSRGPNTTFDVLKPDLGAPGMEIYAAFADGTITEDVELAEYAFLQGTSMSSPHAAGSAALLKALHSDWSSAEIRSAMMLTAYEDVLDTDKVTPADPFDIGAGRIQLEKAGLVGLVMEEKYLSIEEGDDVKALNTPSLYNSTCVEECTWTRTFTSVADWPATYTATAPAWVTVEPAVFTIAPDATQEITITADVSDLGFGDWEFGSIAFDTTDTFQNMDPISDVHMPLAVQRSFSDIPEMMAFETHRDADGAVVEDLTAVEITEGTVYTSGLAKAEIDTFALAQNDDEFPFTDLEGLYVKKMVVPAYSIRLVAEILETTSPDVDMFLYWDYDGDGVFDLGGYDEDGYFTREGDYLVDYSATIGSEEYINAPKNWIYYNTVDTYFIVVTNYQDSGATDNISMATSTVPYAAAGNFDVSIPPTLPAGEPFDMEITWDVPTEEGDRLYGFFETCADAACETYLGGTDIDIHRLEDDVVKSVSVESAVAGNTVTYTINVHNFKDEPITYTIEDVLPDGVTYVDDSVSLNAEYDLDSNAILFEDEIAADSTVAITFQATVDDELDPETIITNTALHEGDGLGMRLEPTLPVSFIAEDELPDADNQDLTTNEDVPLDITLTGTGLEPGPVTWTIVDEPLNGTLTGEAPNLTYTPAVDYYGPDSFTFTVDDGLNPSDSATITIEVVPVLDDPVAVDDEFTTGVNELLNGDVSANDYDDDPTDTNQFFEVLTDPTHGTLTFELDGTFVYDPAQDFSGVDTFTYRFYSYPEAQGTAVLAQDYDDATVTITVNDVPVAQHQTIEVDEDPAEPVEITLTVDDEDTLAPGPVTWTIVQDDDPETEDEPLHGTLTGTAPDLFYMPDPDYNGSDKFTFMVNDGLSDSNKATITINIAAVNDAPVAVDDSYEWEEDSGEHIVAKTAEDSITANDYDVDEDQLTWELVDGVTNGTLEFYIGGGFRYTPDANFFGEDSFTYKVNDGTVDSNIATVTITVTPVNDAPVAVDDSLYETDEDTLLEVSVEDGVLDNDTDIEEDALTAVLVDDVDKGELTLNDDGSFTYLPDEDYDGIDTFTYKANDGELDSNVAKVTITINAVNDAPIAEDDEYWTKFETALVVPSGDLLGVLANDTDVDEDPLTAELIGNPSHGVLVFYPDGSFNYTPVNGYRGIDSFVYEVSDGSTAPALTDQATVYITVNDIPDALPDDYETDEEEPVEITLTQAEGPSLPGPATWTVIDEDELTEGTQTVEGGTITFTTLPVLTYTPPLDFFGTDTFTFTVNDGLSESLPATITIEVLPLNDWPMAVDDHYETDFETTLIVEAPGVMANDIDPDDQFEYVVLVTDVDHGTLTLDQDGSFVYTPEDDFRGVDSFVYKFYATPIAPTGGPFDDTATVTITVDDMPMAYDDEYETDFQVELVVEAIDGLLDNDVDPDPETEDGLVVELLVDASYGTLTLNADGSFTYIPDDGFFGEDTFEYRLIEPESLIDDEATVRINVVQKPIAVDDEYWTSFNTPLTVEAPGVLVNDIVTKPETREVRVELVKPVDYGTLALNEDGSFEFEPEPGFLGEATFTYRIYEVEVNSDTGFEAMEGKYSEPATVTIVVNQVPVALDQSLTTDEEVALSITLTGDFLEPGPTEWTIIDEPLNGTLTGEAPNLTYTPAVDYYGPDSFTFMVNDGLNDSNIATITIEVLNVNDAPVAVDDVYETAEDVALVVAAPGVLTNDTDIDAEDTHTAVLDTDVLHGTLTLNLDGSFSYMPDVDFYGEDSFTYMANDGTADSNVATVTITVTPVNDAPVAVDDEYTVVEKETLTIAAPGVLANDSDISGDALTAILVDTASNGTLTLNADGSFVYTPNEYFNGTDSFTYMANDGELDSEPAVVTITVTPVNDWPIANDDFYDVVTGNDLVKDALEGVLANDVLLDPDEEVSIQILDEPQHGTLSMNDDGSFTYSPDAGYMGTDTFRYLVLSVQVGPGTQAEWSDEALVTIVVKPYMGLFLPIIWR